MVQLTCNSKKCCAIGGTTWDYRGQQPFYATCPKCLQKVKIPKGDEKR